VLLVEEKAGIGKSRLVQSLMARLTQPGGRVPRARRPDGGAGGAEAVWTGRRRGRCRGCLDRLITDDCRYWRMRI
jgi:hypothetical protein